jgi:proteasome lid subunit RPN8/RPN11
MSKKRKFKQWLKNQRANLREGFYHVGSRFDNFSNYGINNFSRSEVTFAPTFKVRIGATAYKKLFSYVLASNLEVSGLGLVKPVKDGYQIYDIFVLDQLSSGAHTDLDKQAMTNLMLKILKEKGEKEVNNLRFWWHSHPNFGVSPSGTDDATGERLANDQYLVSWIVNHNRDIYCRIELTKPFRMTLSDVPTEIDGGKHKNVVDSYTKEAQGKIRGHIYPDLVEDNFSKKWVWDNELQRVVLKKEESYILNNENQIPSSLLRGAKGFKTNNSKGQWKELKGPTVFVNPVTKQNSYNKDEVKCAGCMKGDCGGCKTFQKLTKEVKEYGY